MSILISLPSYTDTNILHTLHYLLLILLMSHSSTQIFFHLFGSCMIVIVLMCHMDGHFGLFAVSTIMINTWVDNLVHTLFRVCDGIFLSRFLAGGLLQQRAGTYVIFLGVAKVVSFCAPTSNLYALLLLLDLAKDVCCETLGFFANLIGEK